MIQTLRSLDLQSPRVLDLGAYIGDFVKLARTLWRDCHVSCVEANEGCTTLLNELADDVKIALLWGADDETRDYWMRRPQAQGGASGNSCFREKTKFFGDQEIAIGNVRCFPRRTTTLDSLYAAEPAFDVVKLDLQGSELQAILGGPITLRKATVILCEQQRGEYNEGAPFHHEVNKALVELGFLPRWESDHEVVGRIQVNRLYVKVGSEAERRLKDKQRGRGRHCGPMKREAEV